MKTKNYFLVVALTFIFLFSCNNVEDEITLPIKSEVEMKPFAMVNPSLGTTSTSNPNLYNNWENVTKIYLNREGEIDAPWVVSQGASMMIPENIRTNIKKEDGWIMLGHTLPKINEAEPNYIIFYNKKTGILKGFYYSNTAAQNQSAKWVLATTGGKPSSLIPSNTKISNLSNIGGTHIITSNLTIPQTFSTDSPLYEGWNCFTFELPYGTLNQNANIYITGYNTQSYQSTSTGTLSGEVIVPTMINSNDLGSWKDFLSMTSNFTGASNTFAGLFKKNENRQVQQYSNENSTRSIIGTISIVNSAVSIASSLLGGASFFTSKKAIVIQRYNFSGNMQLTGNIVGQFQGLARPINDIDISKLNNNEELGVWGLKKLPEVEFNKYEHVARVSLPLVDEYETVTYSRTIDLKPLVSEESVIINPALLPLIDSYEVSIGDIILTNSSQNFLRNQNYQLVEDEKDWYYADIGNGFCRFQIENIMLGGFLAMKNQTELNFYMSYMDTFPETYASVLVTINYKDGSVFSSSRVFKVNGRVIDNSSELISSEPKYSKLIFLS